MPDAGLRRADRQCGRALPRPDIDREGFRAVIERRSSAVSVDIPDLLGDDRSLRAGLAHGRERSVALWMRLSEMMRVGHRAITGNFAQNVGAPTSCVVEGFEG